ncbi:hypothetical protein [Rhizobium anhuiense]|uniref:BA14K family protein n=1 Tax=Rhizobium anhuiense TaxID=1184720 RepID=A0A432NG18_9HYPH|nr:hypothetical protein [Rhizobium anhuiense]RUL98565.1 hypothetical protein EEQ99_24140 [Rhizobium anhuiense]GGD97988.1 hypothetical protein GCM10008012_47030 [Rhizobium anhuiense]
MIKKFFGLFAVLLSASLVFASMAEAASFGGFRGGSSFRSSSFSSSRSYSRPSTSYSRPSTSYSRPSTSYSRPAYSYSRPSYNSYSSTTVNQSSGGGFFSSMLGSIAGYGIASWLFGEDEKPAEQAPAAAPTPAPAAPTAAVPTTTVQEAPKAQ